ncbi:BQ5605_C014g07470 [Microbotryum silenes-dioicae]|uniref:BQ5605_C014g07470 protein n=1 Tax=Microbotryum silenes-dioicae TaxID=796604 RepID=A0A2X0NX59_9BASI|nr:BQ5605_C014g07470 [Microbotryum silenes-dioicae]
MWRCKLGRTSCPLYNKTSGKVNPDGRDPVNKDVTEASTQVAGLIAWGPTLDLASPILTRWCRYGSCRLVIYTDAVIDGRGLRLVSRARYSLHIIAHTLAAYDISFLRNFDLKVLHVVGEQNAIADDLSRFVHPPSNRALAHISPSTHTMPSLVGCRYADQPRRRWKKRVFASRPLMEPARPAQPFPSIEKLIIGTAEMSLCALEPKTRSDYAQVSRQWNLFVSYYRYVSSPSTVVSLCCSVYWRYREIGPVPQRFQFRIISYDTRAKDWWWRAKSHRTNRLRKPARQQRSRGRKLGRCVGLRYIGREYSASRLE